MSAIEIFPTGYPNGEVVYLRIDMSPEEALAFVSFFLQRDYPGMEICVNFSICLLQGVQLKSGPYFNMSNLFTNIYNMLYHTTNLYLQ